MVRAAIKVAMLQRGFSQRETGRRANIAENRLSTIVNGWTRPSDEERARLSSVLGVAADVLFSDNADIEIRRLN